MKRRRFIERVCATSIAWPVVARAQTTEKRRRIAIVHTGIPVDKLTETAGLSWIRQFFEELRRLGHSEGPGFAVERYSAEGRSDRYADLAALVVRTAPEVIVTNSSELTKIIARTTTTIPIVAITSDPIETGLVSSIARPGGNLTGVSVEAGVGIMHKRLQILKEAIPGVAKAAFLMRGAQNEALESSLLDAGRTLGMAIASKLNAAPMAILLPAAFVLRFLQNKNEKENPDYWTQTVIYLMAGGIATGSRPRARSGSINSANRDQCLMRPWCRPVAMGASRANRGGTLRSAMSRSTASV